MGITRRGRANIRMRTALVCGALALASCAVSAEPAKTGANPVAANPVTLPDLLSAPVPGLCRHDPGTLVDGKLPVSDPGTGFVTVATKTWGGTDYEVAFGDVTGDGVDDGVLVTDCSAGGVAWPATVQVYTAGPKRLGGVDLGDVTHGREVVTGLEISGGAVRIHWLTNGPTEPACCPTVKMAAELTWNGDSTVLSNVRHED
ncbi:hypothetical protein [Nocardia sp. BMG111209]|uniref:hypothetical protein n=1 Tax=Nocardia sp. BMG111209 TaxID=1160137 RepID=UPI0012DF39E3|nr:hypothetical protein [Nocardia sp. BMG111209]